MTPEEQQNVLGLLPQARGGPRLSSEQYLADVGVSDGVAHGLRLLNDAILRQDPVDVELALIVGAIFGFTDRYLDPLIGLAFADWHKQHENVVAVLQELDSPIAVDALRHLAAWVPDYLKFDEVRALASNAIWALGFLLPLPAAQRALEELTASESEIVSRGALAQIQR